MKPIEILLAVIGHTYPLVIWAIVFIVLILILSVETLSANPLLVWAAAFIVLFLLA